MRFKKKWKKVLQPDKGKYGIYKKTGIVLLLSIVMFSAVYVTDNHRQLAQDENGNRILERKGQGEGKKTEKIQMETGEWKEKVMLESTSTAALCTTSSFAVEATPWVFTSLTIPINTG